jgi:translation initiation factor IF-3
VEIQPQADPPVCRIMDFGKFKFDLQKKANEAKKKTKQQEIKELKFRPVTDEGDYQIKLRNMRRFLEEGDKVKVNIRFRGREMSHQDLGIEMAKRIEADLGEDIVIESRPRLEGRQMVMMIAPKKK